MIPHRLWLWAAVIVLPLCAQAVADPPPIRDAEALAAVLRPRLPKGWTLAVKDQQVAIERTEPVDVFNGIGLPYFASEAARRRYVRPNLRRQKFVISLSLGDRFDPQEFQRIERQNHEAVKRARADEHKGKLMPDAGFWREHPKYGYRELPWFDTGTRGLYMKADPYGVPWKFWDAKVGAECQGVIDDFGKLFRRYKSYWEKPEQRQ